jgi:hypothetical protein
MLGSAITFTTRGAYNMKAVPGTWQLHEATQPITSTPASPKTTELTSTSREK